MGAMTDQSPEPTEPTEPTAEDSAAKARRAAHVILDGLTATDPDNPDSQANADAMELAFSRLLEIEAIELLFDEDEEELELDVSPLMEGVLLVVRSLVSELAARTGQSPEDVVAGVRTGLDR
jgi:hypothetical protein